MLYVARANEPARHVGAVLQLERTSFAPSAQLLWDHSNPNLCGPACFRRRYVDELRRLWQADPGLFLDLIAQARAGNVTLVDDWGDADHAPRRILAAVLTQIAAGQRDERARRACLSQSARATATGGRARAERTG